MGWSLAIVTLCQHSSSYMAQHGGLHQVTEGDSAFPGLRRWLLEDPTSDIRTLCHTIRRNLYWLSDNLCDHINSNSPDCYPLDFYVWGAVDREANKTQCNIKNELKARITATFTNLSKKTVRKSCRRFQSCVETVIEPNGDFFELI